jgi:hypothetical protein
MGNGDVAVDLELAVLIERLEVAARESGQVCVGDRERRFRVAAEVERL